MMSVHSRFTANNTKDDEQEKAELLTAYLGNGDEYEDRDKIPNAIHEEGNTNDRSVSRMRAMYFGCILLALFISAFAYGESRVIQNMCRCNDDLKAESKEIHIGMVWDEDDSLVMGDDYYSERPIEPYSDPEDNEHVMPVEYADPVILEDIDFSQRSSCGVSKCFWPSASDPTFGYLLTTEQDYDGIYYAYDIAQDTSENCGVRNLFAENSPIVLVNVTEAWMTKLAGLVFNPSRNEVGQKSPWIYYPRDTVIAVQKVIRAPTPNLLYGTGGTKWEAMVTDMPEFRRQLVVSRSQVRERLQEEVKRIQCVFKRYPTYWLDFQGLVDVEGNFYHMDTDENFWTRPHTRSQNQRAQRRCLDDFKLMVEGLTMEEFDETLLLDDDDGESSDP